MAIFLRLKHWQLFLVMYGLPIVNLFVFSIPAVIIRVLPIMMILYVITSFGWIWAVYHIIEPTDLDAIYRDFEALTLEPEEEQGDCGDAGLSGIENGRT